MSLKSCIKHRLLTGLAYLNLRLHACGGCGNPAHALQKVEGHAFCRQKGHCGPPHGAEFGAFADVLAICCCPVDLQLGTHQLEDLQHGMCLQADKRASLSAMIPTYTNS